MSEMLGVGSTASMPAAWWPRNRLLSVHSPSDGPLPRSARSAAGHVPHSRSVFLGAALRGTSWAIAMESRTCLERSDRDIWNRAGVIGTALAVAAGICRTDDRNDRPGMPGPRRRLWSGQPAATSQSFHSLLPSNTPRGLLSGSIAVPAVHALQLCHPARAASSSLRICRSVTFNCSAACFWVICPWLASTGS